MTIEEKDINDPKTTEALKHLEDMYLQAKIALVEGREIIIIQSIDIGDQYINQDLFNEVKNDIIVNFNNYSNKMILKLLR